MLRNLYATVNINYKIDNHRKIFPNCFCKKITICTFNQTLPKKKTGYINVSFITHELNMYCFTHKLQIY